MAFNDHMARASGFAVKLVQTPVIIDGVQIMCSVDPMDSEPAARVGSKTAGITVVLYIDREVWRTNGFKRGSIVELADYGKTTVKVIGEDGDGVLQIRCEPTKSGTSF